METPALVKTEQLPDIASAFLDYIDRSEKTAQTYAANIKQFAAYLRYKGIDRPTRADIIEYREYLLKEHDAIKLDPNAPGGWSFRKNAAGEPLKIRCQATTAAQYIRSVCQLFKWAAAAGLYPNIVENIHAPKLQTGAHRKEALTAADVLRIEKSIRGNAELTEEQRRRLLAMYLLAVGAGLRTVELSRARLCDLEERAGAAFLYLQGKGKAAADERQPIPPEAHAALKEYLEIRTGPTAPGAPLFTGTGNRSRGQKIEARTISTMLKCAMRAAGYDSARITAHSLRHTAGTAMIELSGDLYTTQRYMRHRSPATTEIYLHTNTAEKEIELSRGIYSFYLLTAEKQAKKAE